MQPMNRFIVICCATAGFAVVGCSDQSPPAQVLKHCVSETGLSHFYLQLDLAQMSGRVRYQYFGQDVLYDVISLAVDGEDIIGMAVFAASATGEVRGSPMKFTYDSERDALIDGSAIAECENLQDPSLLELPAEHSAAEAGQARGI